MRTLVWSGLVRSGRVRLVAFGHNEGDYRIYLSSSEFYAGTRDTSLCFMSSVRACRGLAMLLLLPSAR